MTKRFEGTNFLDFKAELLKDPSARAEYDRLGLPYKVIADLIRIRIKLQGNSAGKEVATLPSKNTPAQ